MASLSNMTIEEKTALKDRIARVLSEILSDKYEAKVTISFVPKEGQT